MTSFGRTTRQDVIWSEFNAIRAIGGYDLLSPEDGGYETDGLQDDWDDLAEEYAEIHTANDTIG